MSFTVKGLNHYSGHCVAKEHHHCVHAAIARAVDLSLSLGTAYVVDPDLRLTIYHRGELLFGGLDQLVLPLGIQPLVPLRRVTASGGQATVPFPAS